MEFGPVPLSQAAGAILAHSHPLQKGRLRKGHRLDDGDLAALREMGATEVIVARPGDDDMGEDTAARALAEALVPDPEGAYLRLGRAATGRVNIHATAAGVLELDRAALDALNALDPAVTIATLPPFARVTPGQMVATVKIITYAVPAALVTRGAALARAALRARPVTVADAALIITDMGQGPGKGESAIAMRLQRLGIDLSSVEVVAHAPDAIARALGASAADLLLLLTASATSDARDVGPLGLEKAGGRLLRFGMPVDPGNLLFLGDLSGRPVIGLPGCARSPALNGADWVLERVACGCPPDDADFAAMGVGGLLKEPPSRPHPRGG
ncbi:molybdopterin-binding protein [Palleronia pelagia]|uniref:Molybdenum cofactor cytidylyltransferase n=1 Tax=Palleronia pelagia TaxID=387096 RepID=A0A1H8GKY9_9RHOB|nr:molybdopterin-binding protein [Palleronia pelagia]SEN44480.1 molybdenum cofactor cytidylyltransferase [Palleronia pelagia]